MTRPGPKLSAFDCCSAWLEECDWPAGSREAVTFLRELHTEEAQRDEDRVEFHESLEARVGHLEALLERQRHASQESGPSAMAPTLLNVHQAPPPRYFRALVWNLENFTHDPRPAGTKPIDSQRNQARIAIVADFAHRLGVDALLIMETGADVGQAMTQLAARWDDKEKRSGDEVVRPVEPLVSPATHPIPELPIESLAQQFAAEPDTVRALRLTGEGYRMSPAGFTALDNAGLGRALELLERTSNDVQSFSARPPMETSLDASLSGWARWCWEGLFNQSDYPSAEPTDLELLRRVINDAAASPEQFLSDPSIEFGLVREAILAARDIAEAHERPSFEAGIAEICELLLLAWILHRGLASVEPPSWLPSQAPLWINDYGQPAELVVLVLLIATNQPIDLRAHDQDSGPMFSASDGELLLHALQRLGVVPKFHAETYGVAYRPYSPAHLDAFFNASFEQLGFNTSGIYGVLHGAENHGLLVSQEPAGLLGGRSALKISFPVTPDLWVPFALHHNRYSGSKQIDTMNTDLVKEENKVLARLLTIEDEARMLAGQSPSALIVGDFNLPAPYVQPEIGKRNTKALRRRTSMRENHVRQTGAAGYLRRRRRNHTHPETTMKRGMNIAKGKELFSEPYDAVYQPFDFLGGAVQVRSAAVRNCQAFFTSALFDEDIEVATEDGKATIKVQQVLVEQIASTYRGIVACIVSTLTESEPWFSTTRRVVHDKPFAWADQTLRNDLPQIKTALWGRYRQFHHALSGDLGITLALDAQLFDHLRKIIGIAAPYAEKPKPKKAKQSKKSSDPDPDAMDVGDSSTTTTTKQKGRRKKPAEQRLITLPELFEALVNLETRPDLRLWAAYGGIVSDHLPILVEVELER